ncbi:MAG: phytoene/squalene synthase family protein [candidate division KSB1 bacterium]
MKELFDHVSAACSRRVTRAYSSSFSLGIYFLDKNLRAPIYAIYGFVRLADEITDSFHAFDKRELLADFRRDTFKAIVAGISLNPVLNSFQKAVNRYQIDHELIETFLGSMEMDLTRTSHDSLSLSKYIYGSAEAVGLMCLRVFCDGDEGLFRLLKEPAMRLGAAFQKVNFLRDLHADYHNLHRTYFPNLQIGNFSDKKKVEIEAEIKADFRAALDGIKRLPAGARFGVYVAYVYYRALLRRIEATSGEMLLRQRLRVPGHHKFALLLRSYFRYNLGGL